MQLALDFGDPALICWFGSPWLDHFDPPLGTGKGCLACQAFAGDEIAAA